LTYDRLIVEICPKSGFSAAFTRENKTMGHFLPIGVSWVAQWFLTRKNAKAWLATVPARGVRDDA